MKRIYKVMANGTEFTITDRNKAVSFAEIAKTYMNCKDNYSWSGKVTIELIDVEDEQDQTEAVDDEDEDEDDEEEEE